MRARVIWTSWLAVLLLCVRGAGGATWTEEFAAAELAAAWAVDRSPDSSGRLQAGDGRLRFTVEPNRYLHIERPLGLDGSDAKPLLIDTWVSVENKQSLHPLPIVLALYWGPRALIAVGPADGGRDQMAVEARWVRGDREQKQRGNALYRYGSPLLLRIAVTSRAVGISASHDGLRYRRIATLPREGFEGPPERIIVGRGWLGRNGDKSAPDLDNDDPRKSGAPQTFRFGGLRVSNDSPDDLAAVAAPVKPAVAGNTNNANIGDNADAALPTWMEVVQRAREFGVQRPRSWWVLGLANSNRARDLVRDLSAGAVEFTRTGEPSKGGGDPEWKRLTVPAGQAVVDLHSIFPNPPRGAAALAYTTISADAPGLEHFSFDGHHFELYLNGVRIYGPHVVRGPNKKLLPDRLTVAAELRAGRNHVVLHIRRHQRSMGFTFQHTPADPGRRIGMLHRLQASLPEDISRSHAARFALAEHWHAAGYTARAVDIIDTVLTAIVPKPNNAGAAPTRTPGITLDQALQAAYTGARLRSHLRDPAGAAQGLGRVLRVLPRSHPARFDALTTALAIGVRGGAKDLVKELVSDLTAGGAGGAQGAKDTMGLLVRTHAIAAGWFESVQDKPAQLRHLAASLRAPNPFHDGPYSAGGLHVEYAEALLADLRTGYDPARVPDFEHLDEALSHYDKALQQLDTVNDPLVAPSLRAARTAHREGRHARALELYPLAWFLACLLKSEEGRELVAPLGGTKFPVLEGRPNDTEWSRIQDALKQRNKERSDDRNADTIGPFARFTFLLERFPGHRHRLRDETMRLLDTIRGKRGLLQARALARALILLLPDHPQRQAEIAHRLYDWSWSDPKDPDGSVGSLRWKHSIQEHRPKIYGQSDLAAHHRLRLDRRRQTLEICRRLGDVAGQADEMRALLYMSDEPDQRAQALQDLGDIHKSAGRFAQAEMRYRQAAAQPVVNSAIATQIRARLRDLKRPKIAPPALSDSLEGEMLMSTADRAAKQGGVRDAVRHYQRALQQHGDMLVRKDDSLWTSVAAYSRERLAAMGAAGRAIYREMFDAPARTMYQRALTRGEAEPLEQFARLYPFSSYADDALNLAGNLRLDRGQPAVAARHFQDIIDWHPNTNINRVLLLAKFADTSRRAGDPLAARLALDLLEKHYGEAIFQVAGRKMTGKAFANGLRTVMGRDAVSQSGFPPVGRDRRPDRVAFEFEFPLSSVEEASRGQHPGHVIVQGAEHEGRLFFCDFDRTYAIGDVGQVLWKSALPFAALRRAASDMDLSREEQERRRRHGVAFTGRRPVSAVAVDGDRVFTRVLRAVAPGRPARLVLEARAASDGALLWSTETHESLRGLIPAGPPAAAKERMYALFIEPDKEKALHVLAFDAAEGRVIWRTDLELPIGGLMGAPVVEGGELYFSTGSGAVVALDGFTGTVRWIASYVPPPMKNVDNDGRRIVEERLPGQLVVGPRALYVVPRDDTSMFALRRASGQFRWIRPYVDCQRLLALVPDGEGEGRLVVQGRALETLDARTGERIWRWTPPQDQRMVGAAALIGGHIHAPTSRGLYRVHLSDGSRGSHQSWASLGAHRGAAGNLLYTPRGIVAFSAGRVLKLGLADLPNAHAAEPAPPRAARRVAERIAGGAPLAVSGLPAAPVSPPLVVRWRLTGGPTGKMLHGPESDDWYVELGDRLVRLNVHRERIVWRNEIDTAPRELVSGASLALAVYPHRISAYDASRGDLLWNYDPFADLGADEEIQSKGHIAHALAASGLVFVRMNDSHQVRVLDSQTGDPIARFKLQAGGSDVHSVHAYEDSWIVVSKRNNRVHITAHTLDTGEERWTHECPMNSGRQRATLLAPDGRTLYVLSERQLVGFNLADRKQMFSVGADVRGECSMRLEGDRLVLIGADSPHEDERWTTLAIDPDNGQELFKSQGRFVFSGDRALRVFRNRQQHRRTYAECRRLPGGDKIWEAPVGGSDERSLFLLHRNGYWIDLFVREHHRGKRPLSYRMFAEDTGEIRASGELPGLLPEPYDRELDLRLLLRRPFAVTVGEQILYKTKQGLMSLGGLPGNAPAASKLRAAVASVTEAAAAGDRSNAEGASAFLAYYGKALSPVYPAAQPPKINGDLTDWTLPHAASLAAAAVRLEPGGSWDGVKDLSARLQLSWTPKRLYLALRVVDDVHVPPPPGSGLVHGDGILVAIDPFGSASNAWDPRRHLLLHGALGRGPARWQLYSSQDNGDRDSGQRVEFAATRVPGGVHYELSIPWTSLPPSVNGRLGHPRELGLALAILDWDEARGASAKTGPPAPDGALEWGHGLIRGLDPRQFVRVRLVDGTPEQAATLRRVSELLPDHRLTPAFLRRSLDVYVGSAGAATGAAEVERFVKAHPASRHIPWLLLELERLYARAGRGAQARQDVERFARDAGIAAGPPPPRGTGAVFQEVDGVCVMEAEHFSAANRRGESHDWDVGTAHGGFAGGGYVVAHPEGGNSGDWNRGAELSWTVEIKNAGNYALQARVLAKNQETDAARVGVDGEMRSDHTFQDNWGGFRWTQTTRLNWLAVGRHVVQVRRRDPGLVIDRLMIARQPDDFMPRGSRSFGPQENVRFLPSKERPADSYSVAKLAEAANLLANDLLAMDLLAEAENRLHQAQRDDASDPADMENRTKAVVALYESFLRRNPGTSLALRVLDRIHAVLDAPVHGLVADWRFNESVGDAAANSLSSTHTGLLRGKVAWGNGRLDGALKFGRLGERVIVPHHPALDPEHITVCVWFNAANLDAEAVRLVSKRRSHLPGSYAVGLKGGPQPSVMAQIGMEGDKQNIHMIVGRPGSVDVNRWHCVVMTYDGRNLKLYRDGELEGTRRVGARRGTSADALIIGCEGGAAPHRFQFRGRIDDVRIYNRALNADEIARLARRGGPVHNNGAPGSRARALMQCESLMKEVGLPRHKTRRFHDRHAPSLQGWLRLGDFDAAEELRRFRSPLPPERFPVKTGSSVTAGDGSALFWESVPDAAQAIQLGPARGGVAHPITYLYTRFRAPRSQAGRLLIGCRGRCKVWFNNRPAGDAFSGKHPMHNSHELAVPVRKGFNEILLKVVRTGGNASVRCRLADADGRPLEGLTSDLPLRITAVDADRQSSRVRVALSKPVDRTWAARPANYRLDNGAMVRAVELAADARSLILQTSSLAPGRHRLRMAVPHRSNARAQPGATSVLVRSFGAAGNGTGLHARYFDNVQLTGQQVTRVDPTIRLDWSEDGPAREINSEEFSVRWEGHVEPLYSENWTFHSISDDGVRVWVNRKLLIDNWTEHDEAEDANSIHLTAGRRVPIKVEFFHRRSGPSEPIFKPAPQQSCRINIHNRYPKKVTIHWVNGKSLVQYHALEAGAKINQGTYIGHEWVALADGRTVARYAATRENPTWTVSPMQNARAVMRLYWSSRSQPRQIIPQSQLYPATQGE